MLVLKKNSSVRTVQLPFKGQQAPKYLSVFLSVVRRAVRILDGPAGLRELGETGTCKQ